MTSLPHTLLLFLVAGILATQTNLVAAETTYAGDVKGVECTACKQKIARSLGKIKGVKTIRLVKKSDEKYRLEVITDGSVVLSKSQIVSAIADAEHYEVTSWGKQGS
ncbi:heavy metal-associated domain-containing protein [Verrucomicrobiales bacterium BCK34]|nr:heavy metal-associated domain-containing protein [Verrucomicrobiales bacterium BCK34]